MNLLNRVTVTGADCGTEVNFIVETSNTFPLVEWGILVSKNNFGSPRFPTLEWISYLADKHLNLSCHLCGNWVRDLCLDGNTCFTEELPMHIFQRIQLNFHAIAHQVSKNKFIDALLTFHGKQFIFQFDDVNNNLLNLAKEANVDAVPLFDKSGGAGILPDLWPTFEGYCGYAGGLSPGNVEDQLKYIDQAVKAKPVWVDAETHLRTSDAKTFDYYKVKLFISRAYKFV
jgi:hypothetical protein